MASFRVLAFDHEGRPVQFDTWLDDLQVYLLTVGLAHTRALYATVVARNSSPTTAALGCLLLPYLIPELSAFATVEDLVSHLRTSDARYRATVPAEFLEKNQPPMFITLYFIVTRLPDSLCSIRDHFLSLDPTSLTVDLLKQHLLAAETSAVAVGAARGTPRPPFFEGCSPSPLAPSYASAAATDVPGAEDVGAASTGAKRRSGKGKGSKGGGGGSGSGGGGSSGGGGGSGGGGSGGSGGGGGGVIGGGGGSSGSGSSGGGGTGGGGTCARHGGPGGGQRQQQQRRSETPSPQQLREWLVQRGASGGSECCLYVLRTGVRAGQTCGKLHTQHRCFSRLDDAWRAEFGDDVELPRLADLLRSRIAIFDLDFDAILSAMYALSVSAEGDCYRCVPPDPGIAAAALGASESGTLPSTTPAQALHTFMLDSGASRYFFRDSTTLTPLLAPVPVRLADPSGGPVVARSSTVLPFLAVPSGSLSGLHHRLGHPSLPCLRGMHSHLLVSGLPRSLPPLLPSPASPCLPCVEGRQRAAPHSSSFPPTIAPLQTLHMDVWGLARVSGQGRERYFLQVVDDYSRYTTVFPLRSKGEVVDVLIPWIRTVRLKLRERFGQDLPSFTLSESPQQNGIAECRIGLVIEVARTSMIHAAAPHFSVAVCSPVSGASAQPLAPCLLTGDLAHTALDGGGWRCVGIPVLPPTLHRVLQSQDVTFDELVPFYHLFPYRSAPPPPPPLFLAPSPPSVDPLPPQGPAPSEGAESGDAEPRAPGGGGAGDAKDGAAGVTAGAGGPGGTAAAGSGGARTRGTGAAGTGGVGGAAAGGSCADGAGAGGAGPGEAGVGGTRVGGAGAGGARVVSPGAGGAGRTVRPRPYFVPLLQKRSGGLIERRQPVSRLVLPVRTVRRAPRSRPPPVPGTHTMALRPSSVPLRVPLPAPPESSLLEVPDPESDRARAACPTVSRLLATAIIDSSFESAAASTLIAELLDFAAACHLDYATALVAESASASPPSVRGECALGTDVLEDRQEDFECLAAAVPCFASMLLAPEGDPDAPDIPTRRSYAEAITGPYSSQWQAAMDVEMASWKSTGTYVDEVPPPGANIVDGMWIFKGVDYFQTFSPTPKMTTLRVLLHVAAQRDYNLRRPVYHLRQAPHEWHDTLRTTLAALGLAPATADPSLFLRTDTSLPPFYVLIYVDDLILATADTEDHYPESVTHGAPEPSGPYPELVGCVMYLMTCTRPDLAYPLSLLARYVTPGRHRKVHLDAAKRVLRYLCSTTGMGLVLGGRGPVVLTGHADASWVHDLDTQRSSEGYTFSLGSGFVSWRLPARLRFSAPVPRSPPVLYVDNKAMIALCQEHRLELRTKHIALRYFLPRELQQRGQLCLVYVATRANTADIFTNALPPACFDFLDWSYVFGVLIDWIIALRHQLSARFEQDLLVLRLHSDRGGEFSSSLLRYFCRAEVICQTFMLPASPQQNEIAERHIGLVMDVARTSMIHAAAPHFPWPFAVGYATHQLNLWPYVSVPETSPTVRWTGEFGDASACRVWGALSLVRDTTASKLSPRTLRCVFLGFPTDAPPWQFYHPVSHRGPAPSGVSQVDPPPLVEPLEVSSDTSGPTEGGDPAGDDTSTTRRSPRLETPPGFPPRPSSPPPQPIAVGSCSAGGADSRGAESGDAGSGGAESGGVGSGGADTGGARAAGAGGAGAAGAGGAGAGGAGARGAAGAGGAGAGGAGGAGATGAGGAGAAGAGGTGASGAGGARAGGTGGARATGTGGARAGGTEGARAAGAGGARAGGAGAGGAGAAGAGGAGGAGDAGATGDGGAGGARAAGAGGSGATGAGGARAGGTGGARAAGAGGARARGAGAAGAGGARAGGAGSRGAYTGVARAASAGGAGGAGAAGAGGARAGGAGVTRAAGAGAARAGGAGAAGAGGAGAGGTGGAGAGGTGAADGMGTVPRRLFFYPQPQSSLPPPDSDLHQVLSLPSSTGLTPPLLCPPTDQSQPQLLPGSPLPAPTPHTEVIASLTAHREPETRASTPTRDRRVARHRPPAVPGTHGMALRPSSVPQCVALPSPLASSLLDVPDPESNLACAATPTVTRLLATIVTNPDFESTAAFALVTKLVDFAAKSCLDYVASLVIESESIFPPSVGGERALRCDVLEDKRFELESLAATLPRFASMLLCPEGDPDALDIPTPRSYAEAITGEYSSQWQTAMDVEMASWKSTGTYVDEVPPPGVNIVDGMWIFRVKRPPGSTLAFRALYVSRGFSQRQGVAFFHTFSPTPKMTTLRVLLHVAAQRDYEVHSLDFSTTFLQSSLHEEIWLRRPPGFTGSFPEGTQWSLRWPVYGLPQAPREWHDTMRTRLAALGFAPSITDPSLFLRTDPTLPPFYILMYLEDLVFATAETEALTLILQLFRFRFSSPHPTPLATSHLLSAPPSDESVEPSGPYPELVGCLITSGMGLVLGGRGPVLTYLLTDLGERPCFPPVLYVDNKVMIALYEEQRLEQRTKHIALRYFLARELQQRGQLRLAYVASRANTVDVFTKALGPGDHQRFSTALGLCARLLLALPACCSRRLPAARTLPVRCPRAITPCCPARQRALLPSAPTRPAAQCARAPCFPACQGAQLPSAPRCPMRQRALLPSAPARPAAQRASAPCCPAPSAPCCPTTHALPSERLDCARVPCPALLPCTRTCPALLALPASALLPAAAALGAAACCPPWRCHLLLPP
ncbi:unnamed protein product [Closterium sp. NIES-53]